MPQVVHKGLSRVPFPCPRRLVLCGCRLVPSSGWCAACCLPPPLGWLLRWVALGGLFRAICGRWLVWAWLLLMLMVVGGQLRGMLLLFPARVLLIGPWLVGRLWWLLPGMSGRRSIRLRCVRLGHRRRRLGVCGPGWLLGVLGRCVWLLGVLLGRSRRRLGMFSALALLGGLVVALPGLLGSRWLALLLLV